MGSTPPLALRKGSPAWKDGRGETQLLCCPESPRTVTSLVTGLGRRQEGRKTTHGHCQCREEPARGKHERK